MKGDDNVHGDNVNKSNLNYDSAYIDVQIVGDYFEVDCETVKKWIRENRISGKQLNSGKYVVSKEEFEYLKTKRNQDDTEKDIRELLGDAYSDDWEVDMD